MVGYQSYKLKQLRKYIVKDLGKKHFYEDDDRIAAVGFAKILFYCGEY